jgi:hypothetical protein
MSASMDRPREPRSAVRAEGRVVISGVARRPLHATSWARWRCPQANSMLGNEQTDEGFGSNSLPYRDRPVAHSMARWCPTVTITRNRAAPRAQVQRDGIAGGRRDAQTINAPLLTLIRPVAGRREADPDGRLGQPSGMCTSQHPGNHPRAPAGGSAPYARLGRVGRARRTTAAVTRKTQEGVARWRRPRWPIAANLRRGRSWAGCSDLAIRVSLGPL